MKNREPPIRYCELTQRMASFPYDHCCVCKTTYDLYEHPEIAYWPGPVCSGPRTLSGPRVFRYPPLPLAVLPDKRKDCCCTPETCVCAPKKKVAKSRGSGKLVRK